MFVDESSENPRHFHHDGGTAARVNGTEHPRVAVVAKQHVAICSSSSSGGGSGSVQAATP